jgi:predicted transcriptional regulator
MKSILISIQPKWCEKIANKVKGLEIRKTVPKLKPPFKVYIYCTSGPPYLNSHNGYVYLEERDVLGYRGQGLYKRLNPGVIGEFVCDRIDYWNYHIHDNDTITLERASELSWVSEDELLKYADLGHFYAWHISDLVIYEKLHPLSDFKPPCDGFDKRCQVSCAKITTDGKSRCTRRQFTRPPQSWCYVEEGGAE